MRINGKAIEPFARRVSNAAAGAGYTGYSWLRRRGGFALKAVRKGLAAAFPVILTVAVSVALALLIVSASPKKIIAVIAAVFLAALVWKRLEIGVIGLLIMVASFMHSIVLPKVLTMGGSGLHADEALILFMVVVVSIRLFAQKRKLELSPVSISLAFFFLMIMIALFNAWRISEQPGEGIRSFKTIYNQARPLVMYTLFFVIAYGIRTREQLRLLIRAAIWASVITAVLMIVQYFLGTGGKSVFIGQYARDPMVRSTAEEESVARSLPPGLAPMMVFLVFSVTHIAYTWSRKNAWIVAAAITMGIGLVLSFTRHFWVVLVLSMFVVWVIANSKVKLRLFGIGAVIVLLAVLMTLILGGLESGQAGERFSGALKTRFMSMFKPETVMELSLQNRVIENRAAWSEIKKSPILGIGLGKPILYKNSAPLPGLWTRFLAPSNSIHNSYLEIWVRYGLFGILAFLAISVCFLFRCYSLFRRTSDPEWKSLSIAFFAAYIGFLMKSYMGMTILHQKQDMVTVALMWGIIEVIWRLENEKGSGALSVKPEISPGDRAA